MKPRRLAVVLTRQWMLFATVVAVVFTATALLLLFLLEDSFIDRRLKAAARAVVDPAMPQRVLPPEFQLYSVENVPLDVHARLTMVAPGETFEMRRTDGSYVHVLLAPTASGRPFILVYDVTKELTVSPSWRIGVLLASAVTGVVLLGAFVLARGFVSRVGNHASALVAEMKTTRNPEQLRTLATTQDVREFQQLLLLYAEAWEAELTSVERERQTLAYLAHELRTPLQSASTSLAILADDRLDAAAWTRLRRAVMRLGRASTAILWMSSERDLGPEQPVEALPIVRALLDEFTAFAEARGQQIRLEAPQTCFWTVPPEVAEAIVGNILMNAIQHGLPGTVTVRLEPDALVVTNLLGESIDRGFGLGLQIVQRLVDRVGWQLEVREAPDTVHVRLSWKA